MPETILHRSRPIPYTNNPVFYLVSFILLVAAMAVDFRVFLLACVILLIILVSTYFSVSLIITEQRITLKQGLLSRSTNDLYHTNVSNIRISQNLIERILDVGTIEIATAATSGYEITVEGIPDPRNIKTLIEQQKGRGRED